MTKEVVQELDKKALSKLIDFWDELPAFLHLDEKKYIKLLQLPVRSQIINILSQGIKEKDKRTRRALTANEIYERLQETGIDDITKSNLYYHLQKLEENGLIQIVLTLQTGNILTSYYGRASKLVYLSAEVKMEDENLKKEMVKTNLFTNPNFLEFLKKVGHVDPETIKETLLELEPLDQHFSDEFRAWVLKHEKTLQGIDLNLMDLHELYVTIKKFRVTGKHLNDLADWLEID